MTSHRDLDPADTLLAMLAADPAMEKLLGGERQARRQRRRRAAHGAPEDIERLPLSEVMAWLREFGVDPTMPARVRALTRCSLPLALIGWGRPRPPDRRHLRSPRDRQAHPSRSL